MLFGGKGSAGIICRGCICSCPLLANGFRILRGSGNGLGQMWSASSFCLSLFLTGAGIASVLEWANSYESVVNKTAVGDACTCRDCNGKRDTANHEGVCDPAASPPFCLCMGFPTSGCDLNLHNPHMCYSDEATADFHLMCNCTTSKLVEDKDQDCAHDTDCSPGKCCVWTKRDTFPFFYKGCGNCSLSPSWRNRSDLPHRPIGIEESLVL